MLATSHTLYSNSHHDLTRQAQVLDDEGDVSREIHGGQLGDDDCLGDRNPEAIMVTPKASTVCLHQQQQVTPQWPSVP